MTLTKEKIKNDIKKLVCASCGKPAETDNGLCVKCERDLFEMECVFEVRDYAIEGDV